MSCTSFTRWVSHLLSDRLGLSRFRQELGQSWSGAGARLSGRQLFPIACDHGARSNCKRTDLPNAFSPLGRVSMPDNRYGFPGRPAWQN